MKKEETKAYILEKVSPIFNKQGYVGTSMSSLEKATGMKKPALYGNVGNKDEMAYQAFRLNVSKVVSPLANLLAKTDNPVEKLFIIIEYYRGYYQRTQQIGGCPVLRVGIDTKFNQPKLFETAKKLSLNMIMELAQIIQDGIQKKQINSSVNAQILAKNIYSMIEGAVFMAFTHENPSYLEYILDHLDHLIHEVLI